MRRAILTIGGTVAGLAALLSFKTHAAGSVASAAPPAPAGTSTAAAPPAAGAGAGNVQGGVAARLGGTAKPGGTARTGATAAARAGGGSASASSVRTVTGAVENTPYGPMQVAVTLTGKRITKVTVVQQTNDGGESNQIDARAIPRLTSEALAAQSAKIDAVSGASYTSDGYKQSLQSALDKAGA